MVIIKPLLFLALGMGIALGPCFILACLFPATSDFFWAWLNYIVTRRRPTGSEPPC